MRIVRQRFEAGPGIHVSSLSYEYPAGRHVPLHWHASDQLIFAVAGVMEVYASHSLWLIPPQFALWIPHSTSHSIRMPGAVSMRTLYLRPTLLPHKPCGVLQISPLLRELILETVRLKELTMRNSAHRAFRDVLLAQIQSASPLPTTLPMPFDSRAARLAKATIANPRSSVTLAAQCREIGISPRTLQRVFRREVGTDFETWRRQARIMKAVQLLVGGHSVKDVSFAVGYQQPTTFVTMFRQMLGMTPKAWLAAIQARA